MANTKQTYFDPTGIRQASGPVEKQIDYDPNVDYQALMDAAIQAGKFKDAAMYQLQRNAKIDGEGITDYKKTYDLGSVHDAEYMTNEELGSAYEARKSAQSGGYSSAEAHRFVEQIRREHGYSGGEDGSQFIRPSYYTAGQTAGQTDRADRGYQTGGFSYQDAPSYVSRYQGQIDKLTQQILGRAAFEYDPEKDPTYQQYRQSYTRNGERAMQDTLGQVAARTGGLASSYAGVAAQQTYDGYMSALADKIPELKQLAYSMYQDEVDRQRADLSMLQALEQGDYNKYLTTLGQYNTDRSFHYGTYRDQVADGQWQQSFDRGVYESDRNYAYQAGRDQIGDRRYENEYADSRADVDWQRLNYANEQEYERALQKAQLLAAAGDFSGYKAMGYSDTEVATLKKAYDNAQTVIPSSGGSRSGGSSATGNGGSVNNTQSAGIVDTMLGFGNDTKAYEYLIGLGYSNAKSDTLWGLYEAARGSAEGGDGGDESGGNKPPVGETYNDILYSIQHINPGTKANIQSVFYQRIFNALVAGSLTEGEADKLLSMLGY